MSIEFKIAVGVLGLLVILYLAHRAVQVKRRHARVQQVQLERKMREQAREREDGQ